MTALATHDEFAAYAAELVITPTDPSVMRRASIVLCSRASDLREARELLGMLGLLPLPGHGRISALLKHIQRGEAPCSACRVLFSDLVKGEHVREVAAA